MVKRLTPARSLTLTTILWVALGNFVLIEKHHKAPEAGTRGAQPVKCPTLGFDLGSDPEVVRSSPAPGSMLRMASA